MANIFERYNGYTKNENSKITELTEKVNKVMEEFLIATESITEEIANKCFYDTEIVSINFEDGCMVIHDDSYHLYEQIGNVSGPNLRPINEFLKDTYSKKVEIINSFELHFDNNTVAIGFLTEQVDAKIESRLLHDLKKAFPNLEYEQQDVWIDLYFKVG